MAYYQTVALRNLLKALIVVGIASARVLDAIDMAVVMNHFVQERSADVLDGPCQCSAPMLISLLLPVTDTQVSSRMEK